MNHETKGVVIEGNLVYVDKKIASLVKLLNDWGFGTNNSCEDNNGKIWICFNHMYEVNTMMQLILENHTANGKECHYDTLFTYMQWKADWSIVFGEDVVFHPYETDTAVGIEVLETHISLRFPKRDLQKVNKMFHVIFGKK
jgi:hypothetical protein